MIKMTLPGMTEFPDLVLLFASLKKKAPYLFFDDVGIESVYGGFSGSTLCGGRNNIGPRMELSRIQSIVQRYNGEGVACNVTYSNQFASADDLEESCYDQAILKALSSSSGNGAIVYSDSLAAAIRQKYPSLTLIASTTKEHETIEEHEADLGLYNRSVLNYNLTHDDVALAQITRPAQIEVMVNEYCTLNCPYRKAHYAAVSKAQREGVPCDFTCKHDPSPQAYGFMQGLADGTVFLHNKDIQVISRQFGIEHFKIVGRGLAKYDLFDALVYYLIQPDCWYDIRDFAINHGYLK